MAEFKNRGDALREQAQQLVLDFMQGHPKCQAGAEGMKQAEIFRECGFGWGDYPKATSSSQQSWVAVLLQELAAKGKVERVPESKSWRLVVHSI
jgi:hypothetical protein